MTTSDQILKFSATVVSVSRRGITMEWMMAWLVLLAIAMSIMSDMTGHAEFEGKAKNGVRRAATQLERKTTKGDLHKAVYSRAVSMV